MKETLQTLQRLETEEKQVIQRLRHEKKFVDLFARLEKAADAYKCVFLFSCY